MQAVVFFSGILREIKIKQNSVVSKCEMSESVFHRGTHGKEVGATFGLLPDGRRRVRGLRDIDAQLLLAGAGRGRH